MMYSIFYYLSSSHDYISNNCRDTYFMGVFDDSIDFEKMCYKEVNKYDNPNDYSCRKDSTSVYYYKEDNDNEYWYFMKVPVELNKVANDGDCYDVNDL